MPKKIILIRHGETDFNKAKKFQGWIDTELNNDGIEQAKKLALRLKDEKIDVLISSDLKRAHRTAQEVSKILGKKVEVTKLLREQNLGKLEGQSYGERSPEMEDIWQGTFKSWENEQFADWKGHDGESVNEIIGRIEVFFKDLSTKYTNQTVAVFTHGGMKVRILQWLKINQYGHYIDFKNTSITSLVKVDGRYLIELLGDNSHLHD